LRPSRKLRAQELKKTLGGRCQRHVSSADDGNDPRQPPPRNVEDHERSGFQLEVESEVADRCDPGPALHGQLDGLPRRELEHPAHADARLPPRSLHRSSRRRALLTVDPGQVADFLRPEASGTERRRPNENDLVVEQWLTFDLVGDRQSACDSELGLVSSNELEGSARRRDLELDLDCRMVLMKARQYGREEVRSWNPGGGERERSELSVASRLERPPSVNEESLRSEHVLSQKLAGGS
jgi:hypothetical protein